MEDISQWNCSGYWPDILDSHISPQKEGRKALSAASSRHLWRVTKQKFICDEGVKSFHSYNPITYHGEHTLVNAFPSTVAANPQWSHYHAQHWHQGAIEVWTTIAKLCWNLRTWNHHRMRNDRCWNHWLFLSPVQYGSIDKMQFLHKCVRKPWTFYPTPATILSSKSISCISRRAASGIGNNKHNDYLSLRRNAPFSSEKTPDDTADV
jgi:hypothetical protein